jgi:hypothetical protein
MFALLSLSVRGKSVTYELSSPTTLALAARQAETAHPN